MPSLDEIVQLAAWLWGGQIFDDGLCSDVHMMTRQQKVCVRMVLNILCMYSSVVLGGDEDLNRA